MKELLKILEDNLEEKDQQCKNIEEKLRKFLWDNEEYKSTKSVLKDITKVKEEVKEQMLKTIKRGIGECFECEELKKINQIYYRKLKCRIWNDNLASVTLKCGHLFCRGCIDENLEKRMRKCGYCKHSFTKDDVHNLKFL